jgi:hypothetical protein
MRHQIWQVLTLLTIWCIGSACVSVHSVQANPSYSINLTEFRWTKFPLRVYVEMNEWSVPAYALSIRDALDNWMRSIWNYSETHRDALLPTMTYELYLSNVNGTTDRDVYISFSANTIPPGTNTVGLTKYDWNATTCKPIPPVNITVTTFSCNATSLYVKNVVMHEFGHALGLGHAAQVNTSDGPELMYIGSSKKLPIFPSTLDIYGLSRLYAGEYDHIIQLPDNIPYIMLIEGTIPTGQTNPEGNQNQYVPVLIAASATATAVTALIVLKRRKKQIAVRREEPPAERNNAQEG